jgi:hypothetical protein
MSQWPTLKEVRTVLRLQPDPTEDQVILTALAAALNYGDLRLNHRYPLPPFDNGGLPDTAHEACLLHAARLYRRRDSIDGTISWGDMGAMRVGRADPDVDALYASVAPLVFG